MFRGQCHFHVSASNGVCLYLCWSVGLDSPDVLLFTDADQFSTAGLNLSSPTGSLSECVCVCVFEAEANQIRKLILWRWVRGEMTVEN